MFKDVETCGQIVYQKVRSDLSSLAVIENGHPLEEQEHFRGQNIG